MISSGFFDFGILNLFDPHIFDALIRYGFHYRDDLLILMIQVCECAKAGGVVRENLHLGNLDRRLRGLHIQLVLLVQIIGMQPTFADHKLGDLLMKLKASSSCLRRIFLASGVAVSDSATEQFLTPFLAAIKKNRGQTSSRPCWAFLWS